LRRAIGCFGYLIQSFGEILWPSLEASIGLLLLLRSLGEPLTPLWLVVRGLTSNNGKNVPVHSRDGKIAAANRTNRISDGLPMPLPQFGSSPIAPRRVTSLGPGWIRTVRAFETLVLHSSIKV